MKRRLHWLSHVAMMSDSRIPKIMLFGWLPKLHPSFELKRQCRDVVKKDLQQANISMITWYDEAQRRGKWYEEWNEGIEQFQLSINVCQQKRLNVCV